MREGPDVSIEEAELVLALANPGEVAAGLHQPHQKEPRLAPARAIEIDQHLEEVDVGEIPWAIRQRHRDLATLALPLGYGLFHERHADSMPLGHEQLVQPRRRQPLLARGPLDRLGE